VNRLWLIADEAPAGRALQLVRACAALTAIGAVTSPPVASAASVLMLVAFAFVPDASARLVRVLREPLGLGWLAFVAALLVAALVGGVVNSPQAALRGLFDWRHFLLLPVALAAFDTPASRLRFALVLVALAVVGALAVLVALQVGYSRNEMFPGVVLRNTVTQALTFSVGALLAGLLAATQTQWPRGVRLLLALAALALVAQLAFLQSGRSGFVGLAAAIIIATLMALRGRARIVALVAAPLVGLAVYSAAPNLQQRFGQAVSEMRNAASLPHYSSMGIRVIIWQTSAELVETRPVLGYGLGGFAPAYERQIKLHHTEGWKALPTSDPHNQYLFLWAEAGLLGLAAFLLFLIGALRQPGDPPYRAAGVALLGAWCINSLFSSHFQVFNEGHLIVLLLGVFLARSPAPDIRAS
jgi:O-antigen ligase